MWNIYVKFKNADTEFFRLYTTVVQKKKKRKEKSQNHRPGEYAPILGSYCSGERGRGIGFRMSERSQ